MKFEIDRAKSFLVAHSKAIYYVGFTLVGLTFFGKEQLREGIRDSIAEHERAMERFETSNRETKSTADSHRRDFQNQALYRQAKGLEERPVDDARRILEADDERNHSLRESVYQLGVSSYDPKGVKQSLAVIDAAIQQLDNDGKFHQAGPNPIPHDVPPTEGEVIQYGRHLMDLDSTADQIGADLLDLGNSVWGNTGGAIQKQKRLEARISGGLDLLFYFGWLLGLVAHLIGIKDIPGAA